MVGKAEGSTSGTHHFGTIICCSKLTAWLSVQLNFTEDGFGIATMPLYWRIDVRKKLFLTVAVGNVEFEDVERMLDALVVSGAMDYGKLFDGLLGETHMTHSELLTLGVRMRTLHAGGTQLGPLAVVVAQEKRAGLMRLLGILAAAERPLRLFDDLDSANRWLSLSMDMVESARE